MSGESWYYIKNWWRFQHYRERRPPWLKIHRSILTDPDICSLAPKDRWSLLELWLLASDFEGRLPRDSTYIRERLSRYHLVSASKLLALLESKGLISKEDIRGDRDESSLNPLAQRQRQRQRERKKKERGERKTVADAPSLFKISDSEEEKKPPTPRKVFTPPTVEEVRAHVSEKKYTFDPGAFVDFYASKGWMVGKNKMVDWHRACGTWSRRDHGGSEPRRGSDHSARHPEDLNTDEDYRREAEKANRELFERKEWLEGSGKQH